MHKVKELKTKVDGQNLEIYLPNEMAIFTANGRLNRWYMDLPILGELQQRNERWTFVRTLNGQCIMMTIIFGFLTLMSFFQNNKQAAGIYIFVIMACWGFNLFCRVWEVHFYTKLVLTPDEFIIAKHGLISEEELTRGRLEGALDLEVERAYHSIEHELGGKKRCNLYILDGGRRMRIARGLDEHLCRQTAQRIENYVNRALPPGT